MLKALIYGFEVKGNIKADPLHPTLGIIPYIYQDAYNYYYCIWLAEQVNDKKNIEDYIPKEEKITIHSPKPKPLIETNAFQFLLEDDINDI